MDIESSYHLVTRCPVIADRGQMAEGLSRCLVLLTPAALPVRRFTRSLLAEDANDRFVAVPYESHCLEERLMGRLIFLAVFALVTTGTTAYAQNDGRIVGRVTNTDGRALPGIQVTVTGIARTAMTDSGGRFTIVAVPAGSRVVRVLGIRFPPATQIVAVIAGEAAAVTLKLETAPTMLRPAGTLGYGAPELRARA